MVGSSENSCKLCEENPEPLNVYYSRKCIGPQECPNNSFNQTLLTCNIPPNPDSGLGAETGSYILAINLGVVGFVLCIICAIFWTCHCKQRRLVQQAQMLAALDERTNEVGIVEVQIGQSPSNPAPAIVQDTEMVPLRQTAVKQSRPENKLVEVFSLSGVKADALPVLLEKETFVLATAHPARLILDPATILPPLEINSEVGHSPEHVHIEIVSQIDLPDIPDENNSVSA